MFSDSFVFLKGKGTMSSDIDEFDDTSTFENKAGLAEDMRFLASIPEVNLRTKLNLFCIYESVQNLLTNYFTKHEEIE